MSSDEQVPAIFCDRKKQSTILNMIESDCTFLYDYYSRNIQRLKQVIELYEEFITVEINVLFEQSNSFCEIVLTHRGKFKEFIRQIDATEMSFPNAREKRTEDFYIIYITVQEWLLQGPKGQQFYSMVDIDAFKFYENWAPSTSGTISRMVFLKTESNTTNFLKKKIIRIFRTSKTTITRRKWMERFHTTKLLFWLNPAIQPWHSLHSRTISRPDAMQTRHKAFDKFKITWVSIRLGSFVCFYLNVDGARFTRT